MLCLIEQIQPIYNLKSQISNLKSEAEAISRQLRAWLDSLQNSSINGQRYLTDKFKEREIRARDRGEFLAELRQIQQQNKARSGEPSEE